MSAPPIPEAYGEGAELLDELRAAFTRYVVFPSPEAADAVTLWTAATHGQPAWEHAPRLPLISPEKRCGKSRLMDVIEAACYAPLITINASTAAVCRSIREDAEPTLLVDEADTLFGSKKVAENNEDVRGILNAGHQRNRPYIRWDVTTKSLEEHPTFAMACLASIGDLPSTIMDRGVIIRMRRRAPSERIAPYRTRRDAPALKQLGDRLHAWIRAHLASLREAVPEMPVEDREADTWEPLCAVADLGGGDWPERARQACKVLTGAESERDDASSGVRLLADLKAVFGDADGLYTKTILAKLHDLEEAPWGDWYGKPLAARDLSKLLAPYGVKSRDVREGGTGANLKGYRREDLHEHWVRYIRDKGDTAGEACRGPVADEDEPSATGSTSDVAAVAAVAEDPPQEVGFHPTHRCTQCGMRWSPPRLVASFPHTGCGGTWQPIEEIAP